MIYQVRLDKFQGPLDVLLTLIEEQKLSISEISLASVTQQFLDHIKNLADLDPNVLADFLTVASKLLVIKSRQLLPSLEEELPDEEATDLTRQLLIYKRFKEVAKYLKALETKKRHLYAAENQMEIPAAFYPDPGATVSRLRAAMQSLARSLAETARLPRQVVKEVVSIRDKITELQAYLAQKIEMKLTDALKTNSRTEIIVTFLALLELIKQQILTVEQEMLFSDIKIRRKDIEHSANIPT